MAEFGIVLPEHDLTANEFKELARRLGRAAFVPLFLKFYERIVTGEATIEEQRKALADIGRWTGVEEDKKIDPNANLPVFNIVFGAPSAHGNTSMQVVDVTPPPALPDTASDIPEIPPEMMAPFVAHMKEIAREDAASPTPSSQPDATQENPKPRRRANARQRSQALQPAQGSEVRGLEVRHEVLPQQVINPYADALKNIDAMLGG